MPEPKKKAEGDFDIFITNTIYPEAATIFTHNLRSLDDIKKDCYIVIDTNALLVPYSIGKESLEQIERTYQSLVKENRLFIPGQVAREFARNRASKITELFQQLNRKRNGAQGMQRGKYPLLESFDEYQDSVRIEAEIDKLLQKYRDSLGKVLEHVRGWTWNDPVSMLYSRLFSKETIFDIIIDKDNLREDLNRRHIHSIPPGYKDAAKEDEGIGDLLIWHTILQIGKQHQKSVIFVSGDEKSDWWHKSESQALYPRYELVDEFRRESNGGSFYIIPFSRFLDLYGASEEVVQEVRQEEVSVRVVEDRAIQSSRSSFDEFSRRESLASVAVEKWLIKNYHVREIHTSREQFRMMLKDVIIPADIIFTDESQNITAVEVMYTDTSRVRTPMLRMRLRERALAGYYAVGEGKIANYIIIIVGDNEETILEAASKIERGSSRLARISYILGSLNENGEFIKALSEADFYP